MSVKYIIRKRALGDVLWIEPVIAALSRTNSRIIVHTKYNELFENYPASNVIFKGQLNFLEKSMVRLSRHFEFFRKYIIDLDDAYEDATEQHFLHAYQNKAGLNRKDVYPDLFLSAEEREKFLPQAKKQPYIVIHKNNPDLQSYRKVNGVNWEKVVEHLVSIGFKVFEIGDYETSITGATYIRTNLRDLISLLYQAKYFIGIDSGPSHIAAALKIPSILIFTRVRPEFRHFPESFRGIILKQSCCYDNLPHDLSLTEENGCRIVGKSGIPPCTKIETTAIIDSFDLLVAKFE